MSIRRALTASRITEIVMRAMAVLLGLLLTGLVVSVVAADIRSSTWPLALGVSAVVTALLGAGTIVLVCGRR